MTDYAVTSDGNGKLLIHRADCPYARRLAAAGEPVMTLFGVDGPLPTEYQQHLCLINEQESK